VTDADRLREAGLRVTSARLAILEVVRAGNHPGTDEIARAARDRVGYVTLQAVYEALNTLTTAGLLRRIEPAGSPARYESRIGDNHQHIVCRRCGRIADVDRAAAPAPCLEPLASAGFAIEWAEVTFWGLCPPCRALKGQPRESMAQQGPRP
jgi:Fur family transcriptional regulator, stress-responsive regulator